MKDMAPAQISVAPQAAPQASPAPVAPAPPAFDQKAWLMTSRIEQLNRSVVTLGDLLHRAQGTPGAVVTVRPRLPGMEPGRSLPEVVVRRRMPVHDWWPEAREPAVALQPPPGAEHLTDGLAVLEVLAFDVLGLRGADLAAAVEQVRARQGGARRFKPVFLTDAEDFGAIYRRGYVAEFFPAWDIGSTEAFAERRARVLRKWGVAEVVDLRGLRAPEVPGVPGVPGVPAAQAAEVAKPAPAPTKKRKKAIVVCWDMGHNPAGRGMVIHDLLQRDWDVEMVGPLWTRFGDRIWGPIRDSGRKVKGLPCTSLEDYWPAAQAYAAGVDCDLVVVCKPRLPALALGALIKAATGCPLVLDVDDFELSFFPDDTPASLDELAEAGADVLKEPYSELATRACDSITGAADSVIVSNIALRNRFGGTIVRHARDEAAFHPGRFDRAAERARMGMAEDDFALVFVGTARAHKGVFDIARTLAEMPDKRFVFHLVGDILDKRIRHRLDAQAGGQGGARVVYHPDCAFEALPAKLAAADAVVLLQDPDHPISQYQIPAKVSDASALGLPILVTDVPPLKDLALQGMVTVIEPKDLGVHLERLIGERDRAAGKLARVRVREAFEQELGFRVNRERLHLAIARAQAAPHELPEAFRRLIEITNEAYKTLRTRNRPIQAEAASRPMPVAAAARGLFDVVMFWKQNDTGIYGRRSDKLMQHLLASGRVGRILQFDAPLEVTQMMGAAEAAVGSPAALVLANTMDNQHDLRDTPRHRMRTYLWSRRGRQMTLPPVHGSLSEYPAYVEAEMAHWGMRPETTLAWVCPVVFDFPAVASRIRFRAVVGDLIDDQRKFEMSPAYRERIIASYDQTLPLLDHAFTNCAPQVQAFGHLVRSISVVPNGTDLPGPEQGELPDNLARALAGVTGPVAGYVGNLRDRFDWGLLRDVAQALPHVTFAIVGGGARERDLAQVRGLTNVKLTGVVTHDRVPACIARFDVALVPHTRDDLTGTMNPLKIYNYFSARRPIVATEVENVDAALRPYIRFAQGAESFARSVEEALAHGLKQGRAYDMALAGITWASRTRAILDRLDAVMGL